MPSFIGKLGPSKSSTTKPVLQKLYATPKKWLTPKKNVNKTDNINKQPANIVKVHVRSEHPYENVDFSNDTVENGNPTTVETNVTIVQVPLHDAKLQSAIDNFDKILTEYGTNKKLRTMPKLQKSRTCSIIEAKCILKKSASHSLDKKASKSLENLSLDLNRHPEKKVVAQKISVKTKISNVTEPNKNYHNIRNGRNITNNRIKVKEVVQKINSLSDNNYDVKEQTLPVETKKPDAKLANREFSEFGPKLSLPKSVSSLDISSQSSRKGFTSKIPIKASLTRTFPSTPTGLNILDRKLGSTQNLTGKTLQAQNKNGRFTESAQNLRNIGTSQTSKLSLSTKTFKSQTMVKSNSVHNLGSKFAKSELFSMEIKQEITNKDRSVNMKFQEIPKKLTTATPKKQIVNTTVKKFENALTPKSKLNTDTYTKMTKTKNEGDNTFGSKKSQFEPKFIEISTKNQLRKSETFKKSTTTTEIEFTKYYSKKNLLNTDSKRPTDEPSRKIKECSNVIVKDILINLTAKEVKAIDLQEDKETCSNYSKHNNKANDLLQCEQFNNTSKTSLKSDSALIESEVKVQDYNSDDNSDDSGNISNEHIADLSSLTSSSRNNSFDSLHSISRVNIKNAMSNNVLYNDLNISTDRSIDEEEIFFRSGVLTQLENQRDERLAGMVINLQSQCRGYLARKKLTQRKLQDLAVRCIQRNVRKFMVVRDWPWWRLLVRVTPLLNVHRTEEELRNKTEELELLRTKVDKLESERTTLKHENDKLEAKLSELTADLAEEHSTSTLAAERLDAETSERMRIERELSDVQTKNKTLQDASERLEMELLYAKSDLNGISEEDEFGDNDSSIYKQRYERAKKELEFTKKRLQQQHEDDLEQLVGLKKQLEKKLTDAYEEVEEQRQVVGQWKRKVQKLNGETNDLRLLLEEQNARNNLLEKKQRKFDAETQLLHDELRQEKQAKERFSREKEAILAEKFGIESNLADARLELDLKQDKLQALQRELDELTYGGKTEEEVTILRKQKIDCERRLHDQDEELDELAGQVQLLEQAKLRLEMSLESQRKEGKREAQQRDEELEEVRCNAQKKVKALEAQLENEHEERTILLREKHEMERRLTAITESDRNERAGDEALLHRLKRDLKRTKALLRDTQSQLERQKADSPGKALIRQLRNQIEDLECARSVAVKSKQSLEADLSETQAMLDEANKQKSEAEEKVNATTRERSDLQAQIEENEEELAEVMKKYKATVQQMSLDQITLQEQVSLVSELETERNHLRDQLSELASKLESVENMGEASSNVHLKRMELKTKELESKLELELTTRSRLDVQIARLKEAVDKLQTEVCNARTKEQLAQEQIRKLQRSLRELKEEHNKSLSKEAEYVQKRKDLEKKCEMAETETSVAKADLKLALKRIEDLQSAIQGELEDTTSEHTDSEQDSYTSDESVSTFLSNSKLSSTLKSDRNSMQFDSRRLSSASRSSTSSSMQGKDYSYA